tara:strand:- start:24 stop:200 length:177 start_codon:yes stop_codon:yes gene_type:complete
MKLIQNESLQRLELYLIGEKGTQRIWLMPREVIAVPGSYLSDQIKNLSQRRMLKIRNA